MAKEMDLAVQRAFETMRANIGGPFGCVITDKNGEVVAVSSNSVLRDHDATAHAEVNAIREAGAKLGTHDLSDCTLYATGFPCPMCLSAIIWANIKTVYYGNTAIDAENIGFRDDFIYRFIDGGLADESILKITQMDRDKCIELFKEYHENNKTLY